MINKYFYWYFEKALPEKLCDRIIKLGKSTKSKNGKINTGKKLKNNKDVRNSNVVWLDKKWIYEAVIDYLIKANKMQAGTLTDLQNLLNLLYIKATIL